MSVIICLQNIRYSVYLMEDLGLEGEPGGQRGVPRLLGTSGWTENPRSEEK